MPDAYQRQELIHRLRAQISRTGRAYRINLEALDLESLQSFQRLLRDLEDDRRRAVEQARLSPWRQP